MSHKDAFERARGDIANARLNNARRSTAEKIFKFVTDLFIIVFTGFAIYYFDAINVMLYSKRIYRWVLYASLSLHFCGFCLGVLMTWVTMRDDPDLKTEAGQRQVHWATGFFAGGSVLWIIAVWPVFHFWTLPLSVCFLFFIVYVTTSISWPSKGRVKEVKNVS